MRTPSGTLGTHFATESTTLARLLTITRADGERILLTDHDADITVAARAVAATGSLTLDDVPLGAAYATGVLSITSSNNALNGEQVTIGSKTYTFQTTLTDVDGNVQIGADRSESLDNLAAAINLAAGAGTKYAASTTIHPDITAIGPDLTTSSNDLISAAEGTAIGNMDHNGIYNFGKGLSAAYDGTDFKYAARCAVAANITSSNYAWLGKDFSGSPQAVDEVVVYGSANDGYIAPSFTRSIRTVIELRAANGSLPGNLKTGGTLLGTTGEFVNPQAYGSAIQPTKTIVNADDPSTLWDYVWVVVYDEHMGNTHYAHISQLKFYVSSVITGAGEMAVETKVTGFAGNDIGTSETLTNGSWGGSNLSGGSDAQYNALDGETVTIDSKVYTFQDTLTDVDGNVQIGADAATSLGNLVAAINLDTGAGTKYAASMTVHPSVSAVLDSEDNVDVTAKVAGTAGSSISTTETLGNGAWGASSLSGGQDGTYLADPGFVASAVLSSVDVGIEGLEINLPETDTGLFHGDLRSGLYNEAQAVLEYVNWASPDAGLMTLFAGEMGRTVNTDESEIVFEIQGLFTKSRSVRINTYSPQCRADLGDSDCQFDIDLDRATFTISSVVSQSKFETTELTQEDDFWKLGVVHFLTGNNAGIAIEVAISAQADGTITLFLPAPLTMQVGDTGEIWPGCDKTFETCRDRYGNIVNFRGEPFAPQSGELAGGGV